MKPVRPFAVAGGLVIFGLAGAGVARAQEVPMPRDGTVAEQRQWLLQQVRVGEAAGRQALIEDALARLRLLAPDDRDTLLAILEVQLSQQKLDDATATLERLRRIGAGSMELAGAERMWRAYQGDLQQELQQARLLATGGRSDEALVIYRRLFDDNPPGLQLGIEYWRLRGAQPSGRSLAIARLTALDARYPNNTNLLQILSQLLFSAGRDDQALATLQRLARNPETRTLAAQSEWAYLSSQSADERNVRRLREFIARYPAWAQLDDARQRYAEQSKRVSDPAWRAGLRAQQQLDRDNNIAAEQGFRVALRGYPREADFLGGLGMALMRQGRREQALDYFQQAQRNVTDGGGKWQDLITSTRYWLLLEQADAALAAGDAAHARTLYEQAHRQQPREVNAMLGLADVAVAEHDDAGAERQLLAAQRIAPRDANVIRKLAQLYGRAGPDRLESFIAQLPAAQRKLYAEDLRQLRLRRLRQQLDAAHVQGDVASAIALGRELRQQLPADPWLAYGLANDLRGRGEDAAAEAVMNDMLAHASADRAAYYAQALFLSSRSQPEAALAVLARLPAAQWDEDIRTLDARLRRQQLIDTVWELHGAGREAEAIALLETQPPSAENRLILADWARQRGDTDAALALYSQVLEERPDNVDAQLGRILAWIAAGDLARARQAMASAPPVVADDAIGQQRQLAGIWADLHEDAKALAILRQLIARKTAPDAQSYRDTARLVRRDDPREALDLYALAMQDNGLLAAAQARPRDDRALTLASRANAQDDWLRSSLRSDVETLYQQQNPTLTVMQDSGRRSDGTPGISRLARDTRIVHLDLSVAQGLGFARIEQVSMDARRFETDADGFHTEDFGTCQLDLIQADGTSFRAPGCNTHLHQRMNSGVGLAVGWRNLDDTFNVDIGHSPSGYEVGNWLGGVSVAGDLGILGWSATASRRPMTNSLLSQAGAEDPRTGIRWGGVTANGATFSLGYDRGGRNGVWSNWSWHRLLGENVAANDRARAMVGWYHKLIMRTDMRLDAGVTAMYWRYQHDLGGYSLGQGGYYSPQRYTSLSLPVSFAWRNDDWSVRMDGSVSWSRSRSDRYSRYPQAGLMDQVLAGLAQQYGPVTLDESTLYTGNSTSNGSGYRLYAAVERRLSDHLVLGAAGTLQRSEDFAPNTFQLYLRYTFKPWQGNLPLPVAPLVPYGEFR
jgi:Flp pilus assembly protein TadD